VFDRLPAGDARVAVVPAAGVDGHASHGGLEAEHAAQCGGDTDGSASVAAEGDRAEPRGDGRCRAGELVRFIARMRELAGGKPTGF
jgi:hypothetical protein